MALPAVLGDLLALPTAAFCETPVLEYIEQACAGLRDVTTRRDRFGNLLAHYRRGQVQTRPLAFAAHTDHPAFVASRMRRDGKLVAEFRGGVRPEFFPGSRVRFWTAAGRVRGTVEQVLKMTGVKGKSVVSRPRDILIDVARPVEPGTVGMWDLPDPALKGDLVYARGCDDIAGAAALLALLQRLNQRRVTADVRCLFTRAEEVGFVGAIASCQAGTIPRGVPIIAIECSSTLPTAPIGAGPIMRVGDRASTFTPALNTFCTRVAEDLTQRQPGFAFQRKLMDGGTCESTAFIAYGYEATGICVALGNYHNMDHKRGRIGSEYISLTDWHRVVDWFEALVRDERGYGDEDRQMRDNLQIRFEHYRPLLG